MRKKDWIIDGYDGVNVRWQGRAPSNLTESEMIAILQRLVARHLTEDEILASSLRRYHVDYQPLLEPLKSEAVISVGENPHYTARLLSGDDANSE